MNVLGIHDGHNASAVLLRDGHIVAGVQEERPRGLKNALGLPRFAIEDVLSQARLRPAEVDYVALVGLHSGEYLEVDETSKPSEQILRHHEAVYQRSPLNLKGLILRSIPDGIYERLRGDGVRQRRIERIASLGFRSDRVRLVEHHTAHASSAYYGWGKLDEPVLVLTNDGMGDNICASVSIGNEGHFERIASTPFQDSVAEIYALTTFLLGMVPLEHEYKLMGMAPYASPGRADELARQLDDLIEFNGNGGLTWRRKRGVPDLSTAHRFLERLYHRRRFDQVCGGVQRFVENFLTRWVRNAIRETGIRKIALSGGIFMNVKANKLLMEMDEVEEIFVFPSCGDETNAVGAAYWVYAQERRRQGLPVDSSPIADLYWGKEFSDGDVEQAISGFKFSHPVDVATPPDIERSIAERLARGDVVARLSGRMEFGARALGNRSILANPADARVIRTINEMIKKRDFWMPFAPSVVADRARDYIMKRKEIAAPYMVFAFDSVPAKTPVFAAGVHPYDGTARPHEVFESQNPSYYRMIRCFGEMTGEDIILNTSFNLHGLPIVYTPKQALQTLDGSGLKHLAIGSFLVSKRNGA